MNSKRFLALALCLLLMAALLPTGSQMAHAATADECPSGGEHNWVVYENPPTCTNPGMREYQCTKCFASRDTQIIPALGHTPVTFPGQEATCTEAGLSNGVKCSVCGEVLSAQQTIPALGHSYQNGVCVRCGAKDPSIIPAPTAVPVTPAPTAVPVTPAPTAVPVTPAPTAVPVTPAPATAVPVTPAPATAVPVTPAPATAAPTQKPTRRPRRPTARPTATPTPAPVAAPFSGMSIPTDFGFLYNGDPISDILRIVQQPQGGNIPQGSYTELTVEAAGGEGAYTYEWWYIPELPTVGTSALTDFLTMWNGDSVATVSQAKDKTSPIAAEFLDAWKKQNGITVTGTVDHSVTVTEGTIASTETETMTMEVFDPLAEKLSTSPEPGCNAWKSGTYWCVVYDEAGHHATSNKVQMKDGLYIAVQPESKNLYGLSSVTLTCRAGGGSGHYAYTWYDGNLNVVEDQQTYVAEQMGVYYCEVADYDTLEVVQSQSALAYYAERDLRPVITQQPESIELEYREDGQYSWSLTCLAQAFDGDTENLQYQWSGKTDTGWAPIGAGETLNKSYDHGTFRCTVTDKRNGQYVSSDEAKVALIMVSEQPTVTPAFGVLAWNQHFDFNFPFKGGVGPYQVDVYQVSYNNVPGIEPVVTHYNSYVTDSGDNIVIYDAPYVHFVFIEQNGEEKKYEDYYKYYVTVTDASGQEQTSESVWYWDAETTR